MNIKRKTAYKLLKYYKDYRTQDEFVSACLNTLLLGNKGTAAMVWEVIDVMEDEGMSNLTKED